MHASAAPQPAPTDPTARVEPPHATASSLESRYAIALDALTHGKPFALEATTQFLETLSDTFDSFSLHEPANGLLDAKVLEAIDLSEALLKQFRHVVHAAANSDIAEQSVAPLAIFFTKVLRYKSNGSQQLRECVLWADGYRFIIRELFLTTVAIFIESGAYSAVVALTSASYRRDAAEDDGDRRFVACDGYTKTLDEFRNRRLQLNRLSVSSDLLRQRADSTVCNFDALMQADFVLCLRSLICEQSFFVRWYPRTLVYAEKYLLTGFDLFINSANPARFRPLATLFDASDMTELVSRFEEVRDAWSLDRWEIGGCPLDFAGFMGQNNAALRH